MRGTSRSIENHQFSWFLTKINENHWKSMKTRLVPRGRWRWCWLAFLSLESKMYLCSIFSFWYDLLVAFSQSSQTPCTVKSRFRVCTPPSIAVAAGGSAPLHPPCVALKRKVVGSSEQMSVFRVSGRGSDSSERLRRLVFESWAGDNNYCFRAYRNADVTDEWVVSAARIGWRYLCALLVSTFRALTSWAGRLAPFSAHRD